MFSCPIPGSQTLDLLFLMKPRSVFTSAGPRLQVVISPKGYFGPWPSPSERVNPEVRRNGLQHPSNLSFCDSGRSVSRQHSIYDPALFSAASAVPKFFLPKVEILATYSTKLSQKGARPTCNTLATIGCCRGRGIGLICITRSIGSWYRSGRAQPYLPVSERSTQNVCAQCAKATWPRGLRPGHPSVRWMQEPLTSSSHRLRKCSCAVNVNLLEQDAEQSNTGYFCRRADFPGDGRAVLSPGGQDWKADFPRKLVCQNSDTWEPIKT